MENDNVSEIVERMELDLYFVYGKTREKSKFNYFYLNKPLIFLIPKML